MRDAQEGGSRSTRKQLADALMRLAASHGLEAVSLRHVAAEAGVSTGMVQHYFRTKDEMMTFALEMVMNNVQARATAEVAASGPIRAHDQPMIRVIRAQPARVAGTLVAWPP